MKLSKKTIIIGAILITAVGAAVAYYFLSKDKAETLGWMSSSWLFRKSISVSNSGGTLTDEDVLVVLDTETLIDASKLQPDCDDLRFTDSDESTSLSYWIEGGCDTTTTQVWVRIPSLPSGGKTIYVYYGNDSATNSEESWSGNFILLNNTSCPAGWSRTSAYDGRYPYGSTSYGTTGGSTTHNHGSASCTTGGPSATVNTQSDSGTTNSAITHTHTNAQVDIDNASNDPPYLDMVYCTNTDLNISSGLISVFTTTPSGWTQFSALDTYFPRGATTYGGTGGATTHTHTTTGGYTTGTSSPNYTDSSGTSTAAAAPHTHTTANGITESGDLTPPYLDMIFASKDTTGYATANLISMTTATPPLGWTRYSSLDSKFIRGASTSGGTGGSATHTHSVTIYTTSGPSGNSSSGSRVQSAAQTNHTHSCSTTTSTSSALPAYVETLFYQRKTSQETTVGAEAKLNVAPDAPSDPYCEGTTNPSSVVDNTPEFSAIFTDDDTSDTANYYQIEVNTTSGFDGTTMWDTGKTSFNVPIVNGSRSSNISYGGTALVASTTYYWRIKFWDNQTLLSESPWSITQNFTMSSTPNTLDWLNNDWLLRMPITVSNSGGTLTNEEVLVTIDTATLITDSKLQNDCDDLRFTDSDGITQLEYWVEGGCNTSTTRVWVKIPSLPTGGKTIYIYYNNIYAANSEETWSGVFISLYDTSCPSGWTRDTNFDDRFPYGSSTGGSTGGSSSHNHTASGGTSTNSGASVQSGVGEAYAPSHSHSMSMTLGTNSSVWPPYLDMVFCQNTDYNPFSGMITVFDNTVPAGWTRFSALDTYFPRGATTYGGTGGSTTHTHTYPGGTTGSSGSQNTSGLSFTTACVLPHTHTWSGGTSGTGNNMPPYKTVIWGEADSSTVLSQIMFMVTSNPPMGWTVQSAFENYFFYGSSTFGTTGGALTHTHTVSGNTAAASNTSATSGSSTYGDSSAHSFSLTTDTGSNLPPYYTVLVTKRKTSQSATLGSEEVENTLPDKPSSPLCEGVSEPMKVLHSTPEFSAIFTDQDIDNTGEFYEIEVNTSDGFDATSMWDTGKTSMTSLSNGSRSQDFVYDGSNLEEGGYYYWRIRFWDNNDGVSEWSDAGLFVMDGPPYSQISNLTVDGQENPTLLSTNYPLFGAVYVDPNQDDSSAYEIEVNSNNSFTGTVIWDTGKVSMVTESATAMPDVTYEGTPLTNTRNTYYWRIRFWDSDNKTGDWSITSTFVDLFPATYIEGISFSGGLKIN